MDSTQAAVELHPKHKGKLLRILGVSFGIAGDIGGTIGAGILRTPGLVAAQLWSAELIIVAWVVGIGAIVSDTANSIYAVLLIVISYPTYLLVKRFSNHLH